MLSSYTLLWSWLNLFMYRHQFRCTNQRQAARTRHRYRHNKTGRRKNRSKYKNGCHNNSAVTVCAAHHNINHAEELLAECMVFKWREGEGERVGDTHIQQQTRVHTYTQTESLQGRLSSLWSVSLRAGELQLNPNGAQLGNHLYLMKTLLLVCSFSRGEVFKNGVQI